MDRYGRPVRGQGQREPFNVVQSLGGLVQGGGRAQRAGSALACCGCCAVVVCLIFVMICLGSVAPTEYGLTYNKLTKHVDTGHVYGPGRHFIGPLNAMLTFPSIVQTLEFSTRDSAKAMPLSTRTAEGLELHLHVAFQYHLKPDELPQLYTLANTLYEPLYMKIARDILLKSAANYQAPQYWTERQKVGDEMLTQLTAAFEQRHAYCTGLQLLVIELPAAYEDSIVKTQVQNQNQSTLENYKKAALIRAQTQVIVAGYENDITVILNRADASAMQVQKIAEAEAQQMKIDVENSALAEVKSQLKLSPEALVAYQRNLAYQTMPNATFLFGLSNAIAVVGSTSSGGTASGAPQACSAGAQQLFK
eukprot:TRINITY_DN29760_c0_g1_i2.p1 TRINITY_DN29760_c0_g1~~TRINITY_DN29760_c0_g1_i2.p1  ORF type:complete len:363 (+),score=62.18 TRINITY_DN29760_c0_g1_i2:81-1169(+)